MMIWAHQNKFVNIQSSQGYLKYHLQYGMEDSTLFPLHITVTYLWNITLHSVCKIWKIYMHCDG